MTEAAPAPSNDWFGEQIGDSKEVVEQTEDRNTLGKLVLIAGLGTVVLCEHVKGVGFDLVGAEDLEDGGGVVLLGEHGLLVGAVVQSSGKAAVFVTVLGLVKAVLSYPGEPVTLAEVSNLVKVLLPSGGEGVVQAPGPWDAGVLGLVRVVWDITELGT